MSIPATFILAAVLLAYLAIGARREKQQRAWDRHVESTVTDTVTPEQDAALRVILRRDR